MAKDSFSSLADADDIQFRMSCGISLLSAVHEVVEHGDHAAEEYSDALFGVYDYLWALNKELRQCIDGCLEKRKAAKAASEGVAA